MLPNSFHVIVPSLPGFGFSSPAPAGWSNNDTATVFDTLVTDILGHKAYTAVAGDWVSCLYAAFSKTFLTKDDRGVTWFGHCTIITPITSKLCKLVVVSELVPTQNFSGNKVVHWLYPWTRPFSWRSTWRSSLCESNRCSQRAGEAAHTKQQHLLDRWVRLFSGANDSSKSHYINIWSWNDLNNPIYSSQPATIGLALYDNPIGQLAWISQLYLEGNFDNNTIKSRMYSVCHSHCFKPPIRSLAFHLQRSQTTPYWPQYRYITLPGLSRLQRASTIRMLATFKLACAERSTRSRWVLRHINMNYSMPFTL